MDIQTRYDEQIHFLTRLIDGSFRMLGTPVQSPLYQDMEIFVLQDLDFTLGIFRESLMQPFGIAELDLAYRTLTIYPVTSPSLAVRLVASLGLPSVYEQMLLNAAPAGGKVISCEGPVTGTHFYRVLTLHPHGGVIQDYFVNPATEIEGWFLYFLEPRPGDKLSLLSLEISTYAKTIIANLSPLYDRDTILTNLEGLLPKTPQAGMLIQILGDSILSEDAALTLIGGRP